MTFFPSKNLAKIKRSLLIVLLALLSMPRAFSQTSDAGIPTLIAVNGRHALMVDGEPFFILGAQAHNSSGWPAVLPSVWKSLEFMHANTLEVPVYWEQIEFNQGKFDFSLIDTLLVQARQHKKRLVLLWFATWKNGSNHYMPDWMKRDAAKYPNIVGKDGKPVDSPSPNGTFTMEADKTAFAAVMKHLKKSDEQHTVIMVQVENESGAWGSVRDYSTNAQKLFDGAVPAELLKPGILNALHVSATATGNWRQVFGERADEYFQAWSVARFIGAVAAAGKAVYALPMYTNAALREPFINPGAGSYESGGPTDNVIPIWKVAAPALDLLAPDIYLSGTEVVMKVIDLYDRTDNALFVPELGWSGERVKYLYEVLARGGIGFCPFGLDDNGRELTHNETNARLTPFGLEYAMAEPMLRELATWGFEGKIKSAIEHEDHSDQTLDLGLWQAVFSFGDGERRASEKLNNPPNGKGMVVRLEENKFLVTGTLCHLTFYPSGKNAGRAWQYLKVEEGVYEGDLFKPIRILNGDETDFGGPHFSAAPTVLQITLLLR